MTRDHRRVLLLLLGAATGTGLALPLVRLDRGWVIAVPVAAVLVGMLAGALLTTRERLGPVTATAAATARTAPAAGAVPVTGVGEVLRVVLDVDPSPNGSWWNRTAGEPPPAGTGTDRAGDREPAEYVPESRVVQCPRCGSFQLDVARTATAFAFRCNADAHTWQWRPGTPWPATAVLARRARTHETETS